jgi:hypothetical protein
MERAPAWARARLPRHALQRKEAAAVLRCACASRCAAVPVQEQDRVEFIDLFRSVPAFAFAFPRPKEARPLQRKQSKRSPIRHC